MARLRHAKATHVASAHHLVHQGVLERIKVLFILQFSQIVLTYIPEHLVKWLRIVDLVLF